MDEASHPTVPHTNLPLFVNLWTSFCLCVDLHIALKWLALPHLLHILSYAGQFLWGCPVLQYSQFYICHCLLCLTSSCFYLSCLIGSNFLVSFILTSTLLPFLSLHPLDLYYYQLMGSVNNFQCYFPVMTSLSNPWINCLVSLLSYLQCAQSAALVPNLPIHS